MVKTAIRGNIDNLIYSVHSPLYSPENNITCNNEGQIINEEKLNFANIEPINTKQAYIIHFKYKSTEEFIKKYKKGYYGITGSYLGEVLKGKLKLYLEDNEITKQKIEYLEQELNLNLSTYKNYTL